MANICQTSHFGAKSLPQISTNTSLNSISTNHTHTIDISERGTNHNQTHSYDVSS